MTLPPDEPPTLVTCPNPKCQQSNPATNRYCGKCAAPLQPDIHQIVRWTLDEELDERMKDRQLLEKETALEVVARVWKWAKLFAGILSVATAVLLGAMALMGYSHISDVKKTAADVKQDVTEAARAVREQVADVKKTAADSKQDLNDAARSAKEQIATLTANAQRDAQELAAIEKRLPELRELLARVEPELKKIPDLTKKVEANQQTLAKVGDKVDRLEEELAGKPLPPATEEKLRRHVDRFRNYLRGLGFASVEPIPIRQNVKGTSDDALYYLPGRAVIVVGKWYLDDPEFLDAPDAILREYAHHALMRSTAPALSDPNYTLTSPPWSALESGLADYFACSFAGDPALGKPCARVLRKHGVFDKPEVRNLTAKVQFGGTPTYAAASPDNGLVWAAAFWELRAPDNLGPDKSARLALESWRALQPTDAQTDSFEVFARRALARILDRASELDAGAPRVVRAVFDDRGLRTADSTPMPSPQPPGP
jgi:hypothetical protein